MGSRCTWSFLFYMICAIDSTKGSSRSRGYWSMLSIGRLWCIYIICLASCVELPIVLLYVLRCLVYHMLSKTRRNSRSLHSDRVYLLYLVSTLMLGVSHAVELLVLGLLVVVYSKIPYSSCVFNTVVVVACVIFIHWLVVFSKIYPELFPASPGAQLQEITVNTFSIQLGQIRLQS